MHVVQRYAVRTKSPAQHGGESLCMDSKSVGFGRTPVVVACLVSRRRATEIPSHGTLVFSQRSPRRSGWLGRLHGGFERQCCGAILLRSGSTRTSGTDRA